MKDKKYYTLYNQLRNHIIVGKYSAEYLQRRIRDVKSRADNAGLGQGKRPLRND